MSAIFILIGASLSIATGFLIAFIRSARAGQFDDSYTPSVRMLFDDNEGGEQERVKGKTNSNKATNETQL